MFAEILHLQYLYTSSPLFDKLVTYSIEENGINGDKESVCKDVDMMVIGEEGGLDDEMKKSDTPTPAEEIDDHTVSDELVYITTCFIRSRVLPLCLVCVWLG